MLGNYNLPKDKIIILQGDRGGLSMQVARYLSEWDYNVINVVGGLKEYTIEKNKNSQNISLTQNDLGTNIVFGKLDINKNEDKNEKNETDGSLSFWLRGCVKKRNYRFGI